MRVCESALVAGTVVMPCDAVSCDAVSCDVGYMSDKVIFQVPTGQSTG